ncbi:MAG: hypothetical protein ACOWWO_20165 [Peptococcaceae bacterium]
MLGAGTSGQGYLEFGFDDGWQIDQAVLDKIYTVFHDKAAEYDITDLPVVFKRY